ncbi:MAG: hypothetical protein KJZ78_21895 [Bryobacteraceae bacterium]|nr:hypothetical protein [Bryobacteraceae bacterium]
MIDAISRLSDFELDHLRGRYRCFAADTGLSPTIRAYYGVLAGLMTADASRRLSEISELAEVYAR